MSERRGPLTPAEVALSRAPVRASIELVQERAEDIRRSLVTLHDEVVQYLAVRDLEVDDLPVESPLRRAIEEARNRI